MASTKKSAITLVFEQTRVIAADAALLEAELRSPSELGKHLNCSVPLSWPPAEIESSIITNLRRALEHPLELGWGLWYILQNFGEGFTLVGSAGFLTAPLDDGSVEMGLVILPEWRGNGVATNALQLMLDWAFRSPQLKTVSTSVSAVNERGRRLLKGAGFYPVSDDPISGREIYYLERADYWPEEE